MQKIFEQLSLEYNTESSKEWKRVRALFGVPVRDFFKISSTTNRLLVGFLKIEGSKTTVKMSSNQTLKQHKIAMSVRTASYIFFYYFGGTEQLEKSNFAKKIVRMFVEGKVQKSTFWTDVYWKLLFGDVKSSEYC